MSTPEGLKTTLKRELDELARIRGELQVQLHLGSAEARQAWDRIERKWERVEDELNRMGEQAKGPLDELGHAARGLVEEIKQGYRRVRDELKQD
ncbi:MAG: hypothetical protein OXU20_42790 [Myxococcales bacterium]|nr:hypothetical protein [Myxococcales bacterium]MDD9966908.1 hypothetical protein [Myxococcales bacterium]